MGTKINDDMFTPDVIADPYTYYGQLREEDPVHWNEKYALWVVTSYDDVVWLTRHHELFSSAVFKNDPRPPYPDIDESDLGLYEYVRQVPGRSVHPARPPRASRDAQGGAWLFHPEIHGGLAPLRAVGHSTISSTRRRPKGAWTSCATSPRPCRCW